MTTTAIILSHYKERERNLMRIVKDLKEGSVKPDKIIIICDNPQVLIGFDPNVVVIRISHSTLPIARFAIGAMQETTHCLFVDDDLTVGKNTLKQFYRYANAHKGSVLGFEGNINGREYTDGVSITSGAISKEVDVIIRMYFAPVKILPYALQLRSWYPDFPKKSLDDVFLSLGNKYIGSGKNVVIPATEDSLPIEIDDGGVGQCMHPLHYVNRDLVCRKLKQKYENG